jgi:hypothetical protein
MAKHNLKPMKEVLADLAEQGFNQNFRIEGNRLVSNESKQSFSADEVNLVEHYRFEGESDPGDASILYALETTSGEKGTVINTYGAGADLETNEFLEQIGNRIKP